jgi:predicted PurR-regulated permease PerM
MHKTRWPYRTVLAGIVLSLLVLLVAGSWWAGPAIAGQIEQLVSRIPAAWDELRTDLQKVPFVRLGAPPASATTAVFGAAASFVRSGFKLVAGAVLALVIGIYSAVDPLVYERGLLALVPPAKRDRTRCIVGGVTQALMRWVVGRVFVMIAVGILTAVGLLIARIPVPFALGLLAGVMTFVPYLGVLLSILPAMLVASSHGLLAELWVVIVFAIAHGLEGYVLAPFVAKATVRFPAAFTISVQVLLGAAWGILGFAFATPIAVVVTSLVRELYVEDTLHGA